MYWNIFSSKYCHEVGSIIIPILQMEKLRHRGVKYNQAVGKQSGLPEEDSSELKDEAWMDLAG